MGTKSMNEILVELRKGAIKWVVTGTIATAAYLTVEPVRDFVVGQMRLPERVEQIASDVSENRSLIASALGEDRIFRQPIGGSYVREPVYDGQDISVFLTLFRTERGKKCMFIGGTTLFSDDRRIPFPGSPIVPVEQIGTIPRTFELSITPPNSRLSYGRIAVYIDMQYSCDGVIENQTTDIMVYLREQT